MKPVERVMKFHYGNESFEDQMLLFAEAGVAIGMISNGMKNMMFMPVDSHILSLDLGLMSTMTGVM